MKTGESEVKSKKEVVGTASFPIYDTVSEAIEAEGEEALLSLLNSQIKTNACNQLRAAKTGKPTKEQIMNMAVGKIQPEEFASCVGDQAALQKLIAKYTVQVREELGMESDEGEGGEDDE